jgi:HD-like signal output (HDOD) protein
MAHDQSTQYGTVLFVDDEAFILQLMRDYLQHAPFHVLTAQDPLRALQLLQDVSVDLVISDYNMPDMDGVEFLTQVKQHHPHIRRVISTGYMDMFDAAEHLQDGTATTIYQKPWNFQILQDELQNALTMSTLLKEEGLLDLVNSIDQLPTLPALFHRYRQAVREQASMERLATLITGDPSVTTQVIRLANSAFLGHATVHTVEQALVKLGLNAVQNILVTVLIIDQLPWSPEQRAALPDLFTQLTLTNYGFAQLYRHLHHRPLPEDLSAVGLLYQIGRIVLLSHRWDHYQTAREHQRAHPDRLFADCEVAAGYAGQTSADLSSYLLAWWNFPPDLVRLARHYRTSDHLTEPYQTVAEILVYVERLVQLLIYDVAENPTPEPLLADLEGEDDIQKELYIHLEARYHQLQDNYFA